MSEREIDGFIEDSRLFAANLETKLKKIVPVVVMKNHNHLGPHWTLGTGAGEEWVEDLRSGLKGASQLCKVVCIWVNTRCAEIATA